MHENANRRRLMVSTAALAATAAMPRLARADAYPDRPVKILLGYAAGGTADTMARIVAEQVGRTRSKTLVVDNRPGASGNIAAAQVARATPDGYTILFGNTAEMAVNRYLTENIGFDPDTDLAPVALINDVPLLLVVSAATPYQSFDDLMQAARKPGANLSFASAGSGSPGHLAGETMAKRGNVTMTHVPYKGAAPALTDVIAGHVSCYFSGFTAVSQYVRAGTVRVLAISSQKRSKFAPDVPSVGEILDTEFNFTLWGGLFAPAKTPTAIVRTLNDYVNQALATPDIVASMAREGSEARPISPAAFGDFVRQESARYGKVIKAIDYKPA
ncbi:tripartite tricarboxylate transporter substrate binding protein [soil metagenome]